MRVKGAAVTIVAALVSLAGCAGTGGPTPSSTTAAARAASCQQAVDDVVAAVQKRVKAFDVSPAETTPAPAATPSTSAGVGTPTDGLDAAVAAASQIMADEGCSPSAFARSLTEGLAGIHPEGAIARAVLARVTATLLGEMGQATDQVVLGPADDLAGALAKAAPGATVHLAPGDYEITEPLVLLDEVTMSGAGQGRTLLHSTAEEAPVIVATGATVRIADLSLLLEGNTPASGIIGGPTSVLGLFGVHISGARSGESGQAGAALQLTASTSQRATFTTLEVTASTFADNDWAGIVVSGGHRVSIRSSTFTDNRQCGICFLDASSGSVEGSTFTGNAVAIGITGSADPTVIGGTVTGGEVGVQIAESAAPVVSGLTIQQTTRSALIVTGNARGSLEGLTCQDNPYDLAISDTAAPTLTDNACTVVRGQ